MVTTEQTLQTAFTYHRKNRLAKAQKAYIEVLNQQPTHAEALHGLGMLAQQVGQYKQAEELLQATVKVKPEHVNGWVNLGNLWQSTNKLPEAVVAYQKALELKPTLAAVHNNLGYVLHQQGCLAQAIDCYQKALEVDPDCVEADVNWGNALYDQGNLSPDKRLHYAKLNSKLGCTRRQEGHGEIALIYYRQAIAMEPELVEAHYGLGLALQELSRLDEAIASQEKALSIDANYSPAYEHLGKIYLQQGKLQESAQAYRQWLCLVNPHYAKAAAAYQGCTIPAVEKTPPQVEMGEVKIGDYQFPTVPKVPDSGKPRPFWTVIIPLYNRKTYLYECFASILAQWQGEEHMEILVMDNASEPPMFDLVEAIGGGIVRYHRNQENLGARRSFNLAIAISRGQWIHLIPEDEYVLPGFYHKLQSSLEQCPDSVGAAFTGYENVDGKGKVIFTQPHRKLQKGINEQWLHLIGVANPLNPCAIVIRRSTHEHVGVYDPDNIYTPDWELYKRIACFYDYWFEPGILARYRQHGDNMSSEVFAAGAQGEFYRQGIEISESYLPVEHRAEITQKARRHYFALCLDQAQIPLNTGNLKAALRLVQEALKIDNSAKAMEYLFIWLRESERENLRHTLIYNWVFQTAAGEKKGKGEDEDNLYFAYP